MLIGFLFLLTVLRNLGLTVLAADEFSRNDFPPGFIFGSGSSAYQVEGAANEDDRTPSIWDTFAHTEIRYIRPGIPAGVKKLKISGHLDGETGDVACDEYHKYKEDVELMADLGLTVYRFSISWSRLIPNGRGPVNSKGLQYYNNLINELISHGIQPHVTLLHLDFPQVLEDEYGGWINRTMVKDFTAYANVCFREFGDRVSYWITVNEPNMFGLGGYGQGIAPPGRCSPPFGANCSRGNSSSEPYIAVHNMLLAHASAARLYDRKYKGMQRGFIGISINAFWFSPLTNSKEDLVASQRALDFMVGWIAHPIVFGDYPDIMKKNVGSRMPVFTNKESELIKGSFDFLGLIHYNTLYIKDNSGSLELKQRDFTADMAVEFIGMTYSSSEHPVTPWGFQAVLEYFKHAYGNPTIYVVENGQILPHNSHLEDTTRVKYLHSYIGAMLDAIKNGSDTRGYFVWSFLDLFEIFGRYKSNYGLVYVDFKDPNLKRIPKLSAYWYSDFLKGKTVTTSQIIQLSSNISTTLSY